MLKRGLLFAVPVLVLLIGYGLSAAASAPAAFNMCKACHAVAEGKNMVGPSLFGVVGRKAGTLSGFNYSPAMMKVGTLDPATLTKFLADPKGTAPGNKMAFAGLKRPEDVKAVVDYLGTVK